MKHLTISEPTLSHPLLSGIRLNIILVAKFTFTAEADNELFIRKGDILKLLDRPGDGWLLVKFIDKVKQPGLVPASYVDIAINDPQNPVTLSWLQNSELDLINENNYLNLHCKSPKTINNKPYPISASISNFLLYNQRYWYRIDLVYSDDLKSYIARYYHDFYNLHINLLDLVNNTPNSIQDLKLPKLPEPIPSTMKEKNEQEKDDDIPALLQRCNDLNVYINKLILDKNYRWSSILVDWLNVEYEGLPGFEIHPDEANTINNNNNTTGGISSGVSGGLAANDLVGNGGARGNDTSAHGGAAGTAAAQESPEETDLSTLTNDEINERLLPNSINLLEQYKKCQQDLEDQLQQENSQEEIEDTSELNNSTSFDDSVKRSQSKNIFNNYHQAVQAAQAAQYNKNSKVARNNSGVSRNDSNVQRNNSNVQRNNSNIQRKNSQSKPPSHYMQPQNSNVPSGAYPAPSNYPPTPVLNYNANNANTSRKTSFSGNHQGNHGNAHPHNANGNVHGPINGHGHGQGHTNSKHISHGTGISNTTPNGTPNSNTNAFPVNNANTNININTNTNTNGNNTKSNTTSNSTNSTSAHSSGMSHETANSSNYSISPVEASPPKSNTSIATPKIVQSNKPYTPRIHHPSESTKNSPKQSPIGPIVQNIPNNHSSISSTTSSVSSGMASNRHQYIKCKIINVNNEIIAIKLEKLEINSIEDFKQLIKQKLYFNNLLVKLPYFNDYQNIDRISLNLPEFLKHNDKVLLKVG